MGLKLTTPQDLRAALMLTIEGVMEGRVNVERANAIASLSGEIHKSIRQEWDCRVYVAENFSYGQARLVGPVLGLDESVYEGAEPETSMGGSPLDSTEDAVEKEGE